MALLAPQEARAGLQEGPTQLRKGPGEQGPAGRGTTKLRRSHSFSLSLSSPPSRSHRGRCVQDRGLFHPPQEEDRL